MTDTTIAPPNPALVTQRLQPATTAQPINCCDPRQSYLASSQIAAPTRAMAIKIVSVGGPIWAERCTHRPVEPDPGHTGVGNG